MAVNQPKGQPYHCSLPKYILAKNTVDGSLSEMKVFWVDVANDDYLKTPNAFTDEGVAYPYGYPTRFPQPNEVARIIQSVRIGGPAPGISNVHLYFVAAATAVRDLCRTNYQTKPYFAYNPSCSATFPWWPALVGNYPSAGQPGVVPGSDPTYSATEGICLTHSALGASNCIDWNHSLLPPGGGEADTWQIGSSTPGGPVTVNPIDPPYFSETCFLASDALNFLIGGYVEHVWGEFTDPPDPDDPAPGTLIGPNTNSSWPYFLQWARDQYPFFWRYRTIVIQHENPEWLGETTDGNDPGGPAQPFNLARIIARAKLVIQAIFNQTHGFETPPGFELATTDNGNNVAYYRDTIAAHFRIDR